MSSQSRMKRMKTEVAFVDRLSGGPGPGCGRTPSVLSSAMMGLADEEEPELQARGQVRKEVGKREERG